LSERTYRLYQRSLANINGAEAVVARIDFDAGRVMRPTILALLAFFYIGFLQATWFFPWFSGGTPIVLGLTAACPMVVYFRWTGFR